MSILNMVMYCTESSTCANHYCTTNCLCQSTIRKFVIIDSVLCFKKFETRYRNGLGDANLFFGIIVTLFLWIPEKRIYFLENALINSWCWTIAFCPKLKWMNQMKIWMKAMWWLLKNSIAYWVFTIRKKIKSLTKIVLWTSSVSLQEDTWF